MLDYDVVIIGGCSTGRYAAALAASHNARVALIEPQQPQFPGQSLKLAYSHALRQLANRVYQGQQYADFNPNPLPIASMNWEMAQQWATNIVTNLETPNHPIHLSQMGVDVIFGQGEFIPKPKFMFQVNDRQLRSRFYLLAMGSSPKIPAIEGLELTGFFTSQTLHKLSQRPDKLAIIGGDPSGVELAQTFARFGTAVTLIVQSSHILGKEDTQAAQYLQACLEAEGITVLTQTKVTQTKSIQGKKWVQAGNRAIEVDEILVSAGTEANLKNLNLESVNVGVNKGNLILNQKLQTTNPKIYGCGDLAGGYSFEQIARYEAKICIENLFSFPQLKVNYQGLPWAILTDPQLARVGLTEQQAKRYYGDQVLVWQEPFLELAKAQLLGEISGFYQLIAHRNGKILGASIVGPQASEIIGIIALAIRQGLRVNAIAQSPQVWLTLSDMNHQAATAWLQQHQQRGFWHWIKTVLS